jgi:hypothetical protein
MKPSPAVGFGVCVLLVAGLSCSGFPYASATAAPTPTRTATATSSRTPSPSPSATPTLTLSPTPASRIGIPFTGTDWEVTIRKAYTVDKFVDFALLFSEETDRYIYPETGKAFIVLILKIHALNANVYRYLDPGAFSIRSENGETIPSKGIGLEQFTFLGGDETFCIECEFKLDENGDMGALVLFIVDDSEAGQKYELKFADVPAIAFTVKQ